MYSQNFSLKYNPEIESLQTTSILYLQTLTYYFKKKLNPMTKIPTVDGVLIKNASIELLCLLLDTFI